MLRKKVFSNIENELRCENLITNLLASIQKHLIKAVHHTQLKCFEAVGAFFIATVSNASIFSPQSILIDTYDHFPLYDHIYTFSRVYNWEYNIQNLLTINGTYLE